MSGEKREQLASVSTGPVNDGGPAFPLLCHLLNNGQNGCVASVQGGMSLRDYFAAKAMQGMYANASLTERSDFDTGSSSAVAYGIADAMLAARLKP